MPGGSWSSVKHNCAARQHWRRRRGVLFGKMSKRQLLTAVHRFSARLFLTVCSLSEKVAGASAPSGHIGNSVSEVIFGTYYVPKVTSDTLLPMWPLGAEAPATFSERLQTVKNGVTPVGCPSPHPGTNTDLPSPYPLPEANSVNPCGALHC